MKTSQDAFEVGKLVEVEVGSLNYSPDAVGRIDGFVVFVRGGVPGDRVAARITKVKKNFANAEVIDVLSVSPHRCEPPCAHFTEGCGGCQWQHIVYEYQIQSKMEVIRQALKRIGKLENIPEIEIRRVGTPFQYRNKLTLFREKESGKFGPLKFNTHEVVPIKKCPISRPMIGALSSIFEGSVFSAGSKIEKINIRSSDKDNEIVLLCVYKEDAPTISADIDKLSNLPGIASIFRCTESNNGHLGKFTLEYGEPVIREEVHGIEYKIGPECFFQVNRAGLAELIELVRKFAGTHNNIVVDAHCGVGTFALQIADVSAFVMGLDISQPAIDLAKSNAEDNGIRNAIFSANRISRVLRRHMRHADLDLVILDPPRSGCEKADLRRLIRAQPKKVIYVSCNPTTLARDLHELANVGYQLSGLSMVDMFPMTYHLEVVALCVRTGSIDLKS